MKTILLPTDFSENSINAIHYAMELFKEAECTFYLFNVQKASSYISGDLMTVSSTTSVYKTLIDDSKKSVSEIISKLEKKYQNKKHQFHCVVDYDNFIDAVNQVAENHNIDLIVMGTKGATGLSKIIFGSNTVKIMQRSNLPVLAVPSGFKFKVANKIAFVSSNFKLVNVEKLKPLQDIILLKKSELHVLHLSEETQLDDGANDNMNFINTNFEAVKHEFMEATPENMYDKVHKYIVNNDINILAMMDKKHSFLERLFKTQDIQRFAFKIDIPFLVMRNS